MGGAKKAVLIGMSLLLSESAPLSPGRTRELSVYCVLCCGRVSALHAATRGGSGRAMGHSLTHRVAAEPFPCHHAYFGLLDYPLALVNRLQLSRHQGLPGGLLQWYVDAECNVVTVLLGWSSSCVCFFAEPVLTCDTLVIWHHLISFSFST